MEVHLGHDDENILTEEEDRFLKELRNTDWRLYVFQKDLYPPGSDRESFYSDQDKKSGPVIQAMDLIGVKHYSLSELELITDSFGESNLIRELSYRKLFGVEINQKRVLVKIWDVEAINGQLKVSDELRHRRSSKIKNHPNVVNIIGYHCDKRLAVIYEGTRPKHFLSDIIESDDFGWEGRLKVAFDIASILEAFHGQGLLHRGILLGDCFMIYEDYVVMNYDFNVHYHSNCIQTIYNSCLFPTETPGPYAYIDESAMTTTPEEVFAYGILLLKLLSKNVPLGKLRDWWSANKSRGDLVHQSFQVTKEVRSKVTDLVARCLIMKEADMHLKPSMDDVVKILSELQGPILAAKRQKL